MAACFWILILFGFVSEINAFKIVEIDVINIRFLLFFFSLCFFPLLVRRLAFERTLIDRITLLRFTSLLKALKVALELFGGHVIKFE